VFYFRFFSAPLRKCKAWPDRCYLIVATCQGDRNFQYSPSVAGTEGRQSMGDTERQSSVHSVEEGKPGAVATFPYDRAMVERFRQAFPRARWREDMKAWFVPGTTAERRIGRWLAHELPAAADLADARGRDAYAFEPIGSPYLEVVEDLRIRTPFSRTIIDEMRQIPWAWWDDERRVWRVPFRSYEDLRQRWPAIEAAARRNEPAERARRAQERAGTIENDRARRMSAERRRRRMAVSLNALPPVGLPVATEPYGIVIVDEVTGELVDRDAVDPRVLPIAQGDRDLVWATWHTPSLADLIAAWPARRGPTEGERARGWWQATLEELRAARRLRRSRERAATRRGAYTARTEEDERPGDRPQLDRK
jgi:hypothetical protein